MTHTFTSDQLVRFGLYLMSDERKDLYRKQRIKGKPLEVRLKEVHKGDIDTFIEREKICEGR